MYETTFEGGIVNLLNRTEKVAESAYDKYLREAWAPYDNELTRNYKGVENV